MDIRWSWGNYHKMLLSLLQAARTTVHMGLGQKCYTEHDLPSYPDLPILVWSMWFPHQLSIVFRLNFSTVLPLILCLWLLPLPLPWQLSKLTHRDPHCWLYPANHLHSTSETEVICIIGFLAGLMPLWTLGLSRAVQDAQGCMMSVCWMKGP